VVGGEGFEEVTKIPMGTGVEEEAEMFWGVEEGSERVENLFDFV